MTSAPSSAASLQRLLLQDPTATLRELDRLDSEESLAGFMQCAWHILEPGRPLLWGWAIGAICEHLEAVSSGQITRLLMNVPPGMTKSLSTAVFWPAWEWGPRNRPDLRYIGAAHSLDLSQRDSRRMRSVVTSEWYQGLWGDRVRLSRDQATKLDFENTAAGKRMAVAAGGITGHRGDRVIIDDPHSVTQAESTKEREAVLTWFREAVPTRLNDPATSAIIVIMQRLHEGDVSGEILAREAEYTHLCLPMEFEPDRRCVTSIGFKDPRTEEGELLFPERFPRAVVDRDKATMGAYATAGQLQQLPAPRQGGMFAVDKMEVASTLPAERTRTIRYWDKAGTAGGGAYTAGVKMSLLADGSYLVDDVVRGQWSAGKREEMIRTAAEADGPSVVIWIEQEPGSGGKESAESTIRNLAGFSAHADRVSGDKEVRAGPYSAQVEIGQVRLLKGQWNKGFIDEHRLFPAGKYKDQVDAAAGAFAKLTKPAARPGTREILLG